MYGIMGNGSLFGNGGNGQSKYAKLTHRITAGATPGSIVAGVWTTRPINTIEQDNDSIILSLSSNQFSLGAGTYDINATCGAGNMGGHIARLYNITDVSETALGSQQVFEVPSFIKTRIILTATKIFEIQHISNQTQNGEAWGFIANISGNDNILLTLEITRY
jgi:hypothetical protein